MTLQTARAKLVAKLEALKSRGSSENSAEVQWLRYQLREADRELLAQEVERLKNRLSFSGSNLTEQLGADAWLIS